MITSPGRTPFDPEEDTGQESAFPPPPPPDEDSPSDEWGPPPPPVLTRPPTGLRGAAGFPESPRPATSAGRPDAARPLTAVRAPSPGEVRPFVFRNLPRVSRAQALISDRLEWLMPTAGADRESMAAVCARLKELFEEEVQLVLDHTHVVTPQQLRKIAAEPTFLAVLSPAPQRTRGLLEVDLSLCHASIDKLLGGTGDSVALRPLTDIEEGVMAYIILEVLKTLAPNLDPGLPRPRLEGTLRGLDQAMSLVAEESQLAVLQFKATLGTQAGFVRLFIPASIVGMTNSPTEGPERRARRRLQIQRNLPRLKLVKTWLRAEIGRAEIYRKDLAGIRSGDVVLLDELTARPDRGEGGTVKLRVGRGQVGRLLADLVVDEGQLKARITGFEHGEEPRTPPQPGEGAPATDDSGGAVSEQNEQGEGADLLADIPLAIAVEVARVAVTADAVVGLKSGQILDLNKVPGEPVELSVNGKIIARGELVEIEGHLGVKVLSLVD
ncbi:MAG: type III secretion system cytoplasmic ring protein SctQ [Myxococcota bacterium]|nr:type III secretion system cytoplasmic ring protein SctQ [Myxococcota bacterium]